MVQNSVTFDGVEGFVNGIQSFRKSKESLVSLTREHHEM